MSATTTNTTTTKTDPRTAPYYFTPTDRSAATLDEFLAICRAEPSLAEQHLRAGWFGPWLSDAGYTQLAAAAVAEQAERPLDAFLAVAERRPGHRSTTAASRASARRATPDRTTPGRTTSSPAMLGPAAPSPATLGRTTRPRSRRPPTA